MRLLATITALGMQFILSVSIASLGPAFPKGPNPELTPGALCNSPSAYRYPEKIAYCNRNVDTNMKADIIREYDSQLGYRIREMPRNNFKIDHYIPLCMGGSNEKSNLWPQHASVYEVTDKFESIECEKMSEGKLSQKEAIELIRTVKNDLKKADEVMKRLSAL